MSKTAREIELEEKVAAGLRRELIHLNRAFRAEKKLETAVKALKFYADRKTWNCCHRNQCAYVDGYIAQQALKEIKG